MTGWERWQGPLYARTTSGLEQSSDDEEVIMLRLSSTPPLDVGQSLSVEWREGDVW